MSEQHASVLPFGKSATAPELAEVCWLRRQILSPAVSAIATDVPVPWLVSTSLNCSPNTVRNYALWWIAHPDSGSDFASRTWWTHWLPGSVILRAMTWLGYDGIVYFQGDVILGHVFFQRRGTALHAFSTALTEAFYGSGYSVVMLLDFLAYASRVPCVTRARVGRGQNNVTARLLTRLRSHEARLGWQVGADGWVTFPSDERMARLNCQENARKCA